MLSIFKSDNEYIEDEQHQGHLKTLPMKTLSNVSIKTLIQRVWKYANHEIQPLKWDFMQ